MPRCGWQAGLLGAAVTLGLASFPAAWLAMLLNGQLRCPSAGLHSPLSCPALLPPHAGEAPDINCDNPACGKPFHRCARTRPARGLPVPLPLGSPACSLSLPSFVLPPETWETCTLQALPGGVAQFRRALGQVRAAAKPQAPPCTMAACSANCHARRERLLSFLGPLPAAPCRAADTSTRQSFNTLFGACPYCSSPITVKVA